MMKHLALFIFILLNIRIADSQTVDCRTINDKIITKSIIKNDSLLIETYDIIKHCLKLDSIDLLIFNPTSYATLVIGLQEQSKSITYGTVINTIRGVIQSEYYINTRKSVKFHHDYAERVVSKKDSAIIWKGFRALNESVNTDSLISFIYETENEGLTYEKAYLKYLDKLNGLREERYQEEENKFNEIFQEFDDYSYALNKAKKEGKNLILYFPGYTNIHGRKFEATILRNPSITEKIKPHIDSFIDLYFTRYSPNFSQVDSVKLHYNK